MRGFSIALILVMSFCSTAPAAGAEPSTRKWTSRDGRYEVQAELVRYDGKVVQLRKADGTTITVPITNLSSIDRAFLKTHVKATTKTGPPAQNDPAADAAKKSLADRGIHVNSLGPALSKEADLTKAIRSIIDHRRHLETATAKVTQAGKKQDQIEQQIIRGIVVNTQLTAQLANRNSSSAAAQIRLTNAINSNRAQIQLAILALAQQEKYLASVRSETNTVREAYIQSVLDARQLADAIGKEYQDLSADSDVQVALAKLNKPIAKDYELVPSHMYQQQIAKLASLESEILTEAVPLHGAGGTMRITTVINGKHTKEMILDSGASLVTLPYAVAKDCDIKIPDAAPRLTLAVADGRKIAGRLVSVDTIRVGQFIVENVDCVVLGPEATSAPTLLGMSFLANFKFQVNTDAQTLTLVRVKAEEASSDHQKPNRELPKK